MTNLEKALRCVESEDGMDECRGFCDCIDVIARALRRAMKDSERLDHMERNPTQPVNNTEWGWRAVGVGYPSERRHYYKTVRAAIDAAIRAKRRKGK